MSQLYTMQSVAADEEADEQSREQQATKRKALSLIPFSFLDT
jgi:hypothetical protein